MDQPVDPHSEQAAAEAWAKLGDTLGVAPEELKASQSPVPPTITPQQESQLLARIDEGWFNVMGNLSSARSSARRLAGLKGEKPEVAQANARAVMDDVRERWRPWYEAFLAVPGTEPGHPSTVAAAATEKLAELDAELAKGWA
jgi:hypothetical protein